MFYQKPTCQLHVKQLITNHKPPLAISSYKTQEAMTFLHKTTIGKHFDYN